MSNAPESALNEGEIREELEKTLRPLEVLALALGAIVGWGCFVLPAIRFLPSFFSSSNFDFGFKTHELSRELLEFFLC